MAAKHFQKPTEAELEILQILWQDGEQTVKYVNDKLNEKKEAGYTTTLKIMQIMNEKGLVERNTDAKSHVYRALIDETEAKKMLLDRFLETAFGGSAMNLVLQALNDHKTSKSEREKIKKVIEEIEGRRK
jgi:BlaI family transcriptional regulator, penicillinase repressor